MKMLIAMSPTILLVVYAQLVTKWRVTVLSGLMLDAPDSLARLLVYLKDPLIVTSYFAALGGSVAWVFVVEKFDIAVAFPIYVGLTVVAMAIMGTLLFGEQLGISRMAGVALIIFGVALVSR